jgi:hypothetical protein
VTTVTYKNMRSVANINEKAKAGILRSAQDHVSPGFVLSFSAFLHLRPRLF